MIKTEGTLVILTPGFAASEDDSTCLPMQQSFLRTLSELYPDLRIVVLSFQYPYRESCYQWHDAAVYSFNGRNKGGLQRLWLRRKIMRVLRQIHASGNLIGLLSFWYGECAAVGQSFGKRKGIRHFCWILGQDAREVNPYPHRCRIPSKDLVALSDSLQQEFDSNHHTRPAHLVPAGINPVHMPVSPTSKDIDLLAVGSLIPLKQFHLFVELVAQLKKEFPAVKAVLCGEGPEREAVQKLISRYALEDALQLTGELPHHVVISMMQRAKIFVHPSSYEGFSGVCLEALYAGAQVVSFVQPMKNNIDGWHIVDTPQALLSKTIQLLKNNTDQHSRLPFHMKDSVHQMMRLFK